MKKFLVPLLLFFANLNAEAQKKAVTDNGDEVVLYDDGTWKSVNADSSSQQNIPVNLASFTKSKNTAFLLKSTKCNIGVWVDAKKWQFKKGIRNEDAEFEFASKGNDLYGMMISEKIEIPIESLKEIALENAKKVASDVYIVKQEYRTVNGKKMLLMQMNGTLRGVKFAYYGYYYSNPGGTVQLVSYTSQNLLKDRLADAEEFLNGIVTLE
jgi:hypothetical protein